VLDILVEFVVLVIILDCFYWRRPVHPPYMQYPCNVTAAGEVKTIFCVFPSCGAKHSKWPIRGLIRGAHMHWEKSWENFVYVSQNNSPILRKMGQFLGNYKIFPKCSHDFSQCAEMMCTFPLISLLFMNMLLNVENSLFCHVEEWVLRFVKRVDSYFKQIVYNIKGVSILCSCKMPNLFLLLNVNMRDKALV